MKSVILTTRNSTRLMPITSSRPKSMIPIVGKPLLEYTILGLKEAGIDEILLIVGYKKDKIRNYFGNGIDKFQIKIEYKNQEEYLGTTHVFDYAKDFVKNEPFLMIDGDLFVDPIVFKELLSKFNENKIEGLISLVEVKKPQDNRIITLNSNSFVEGLVGKPSVKLNIGNMVNAGIYIFDPLIFKAIKRIKKSVRNKFEFTDLMEILINQLYGKIRGCVIKDRFWSDIGLHWQLFDVNIFLLDRIERKILGNIENNVQIIGNVHIGRNTNVRFGSCIQGPCFIGENTLIGPNAYIRSYTSVGDNCHIGLSEVKNSIIFSNSKALHFNYVGDSIICENVILGAGSKTSNLRFDNKSIYAEIKGERIDSGRRKLGAVIGPNVRIGMNVNIMCGKKIGENSVIGAQTLIKEDVPSNTLYYQDSYENIKKKSNPFYYL